MNKIKHKIENINGERFFFSSLKNWGDLMNLHSGKFRTNKKKYFCTKHRIKVEFTIARCNDETKFEDIKRRFEEWKKNVIDSYTSWWLKVTSQYWGIVSSVQESVTRLLSQTSHGHIIAEGRNKFLNNIELSCDLAHFFLGFTLKTIKGTLFTLRNTRNCLLYST